MVHDSTTFLFVEITIPLLGSAAIKEVVFYQDVGIGQGAPFSPQFFSFCATIVIYPLRHLQTKVGMYLYVDDFLITFRQEATKHQVRGRLKRSARAVQLFGRLAVLETHTLRY